MVHKLAQSEFLNSVDAYQRSTDVFDLHESISFSLWIHDNLNA